MMTSPSDHYAPLPDGQAAARDGLDYRRFEPEARWYLAQSGFDPTDGFTFKLSPLGVVLADNDCHDVCTLPWWRVQDIDWQRVEDYLAEAALDESIDDESRQEAVEALHVLRFEPQTVEAPPDQDYIEIHIDDRRSMRLHRWAGVPEWPHTCTRYTERDPSLYPGCFSRQPITRPK